MAERAHHPTTLVVRERKRKSPASLLEPNTVLGSYRLISVIGEGAVGRVYLAEHTKLGRKVALKVLRSELTANQKLIKRFFAEARAANAIAHENIVAITDFVEDEKNPYYIMELLEGRTLATRIETEGALPITETLTIARQLVDALEAAHAKNIVHRDLKPANVYLTRQHREDNFVKLLDFGVAKLGDDETNVHTNVGDLLGTPDYMSPEQTYGIARIDHRSDIYAAGLILYEMLAGRRPFDGESMEQIFELHRSAPPPRPSTVPGAVEPLPPELEALVMRCLAKKPDDRPQSVKDLKEVIEDLYQVLGPSTFSSTSSMVIPVEDAPRSLVAATIAFVVGVLALCVVTAYLMLRSPSPAAVEIAPAPQLPQQLAPQQAAPEPAVAIDKADDNAAETSVEKNDDDPNDDDKRATRPRPKKARRAKLKARSLDEGVTINPF